MRGSRGAGELPPFRTLVDFGRFVRLLEKTEVARVCIDKITGQGIEALKFPARESLGSDRSFLADGYLGLLVLRD